MIYGDPEKSFAHGFYLDGKDDGREEGKAEGIIIGRAEGITEGRNEAKREFKAALQALAQNENISLETLLNKVNLSPDYFD